MQSQPYVEVAKVAVYEYATSKCARDAPSRAGGVYGRLDRFCVLFVRFDVCFMRSTFIIIHRYLTENR